MTIRWNKILWGTAGTLVALFPAFLMAHYEGPDSGHAGAPVTDDPLSCATSGCHTGLQKGGPLNSAGGSVTVSFSSGSTYTPGGAPITVTVTASDPVNTHFGFQMTARVGSTASSKTPQQAGSFNPGPNSGSAANPIIVLCSDNNFRPSTGCSSSAPYEYIEHYFTAYTLVYKTSQSYTFTWTPPATNVGNVNFYIAGNVVNYDDQADAPDHVYTASYVLTPFIPFTCTNTTQPVITFVDSASGYGGYPYFASGTWLEIKGTNLADPADPRLSAATNPGQWTAADFSGANAPTVLDGVSVSINEKPAYVWYLSPGQLNVQAPEDTATGNVSITVTNCKATSPAFTFARQALAPGFLAPSNYTANGTPYMVATFNSDGAYVLNTGTFAGLNSRPAKPGDLIVAYGIGFGDVTPSILPGVIVGGANTLVNPVTISFGSTPAGTLVYQGLAGNFVGLYEFYITVPPGLANGDYQINVKQNGIAVPQTMYLTVHN